MVKPEFTDPSTYKMAEHHLNDQLFDELEHEEDMEESFLQDFSC